MLRKEIGNCLPQNAFAVSVDDADVLDAGQKCLIEKFIHAVQGFVRGQSDDFQFRTDFLRGV